MLVSCVLRNQVLSDNWHGCQNYRPQHCVYHDTSAHTPFGGIPVVRASVVKSRNGHRCERGKLACL